ncbi:DUF4231 domain-containing protein [Saccharothrix xinjiangensis]|uniref:DUF4231 domain-containing protein n=1 Tax=Saccharothrix xinjiangensis TaxID=204798 RepID=A0ABV9Y531_9PSEU
MTNSDLPGFFQDADAAARRGQRRTLRWNRIRLVATVAAAVGGALPWKIGSFEFWAAVAVAGFAVALAVEIVLLATHPERDWFNGRAVAESVKTLAWRFAVGGDPFPATVPPKQARTELRRQVAAVLPTGEGRLALGSDDPCATPGMTGLRARPFAQRRAAYLAERVLDQKRWYADKARTNERRALLWRLVLVVGELTALGLAACRLAGLWDLDLSGVMAAAVAGGAAWLGLRRHSALASAYGRAAAELALVHDHLVDVDEDEWPAAVAQAEGVMTDERTLWLNTRPSDQ